MLSLKFVSLYKLETSEEGLPLRGARFFRQIDNLPSLQDALVHITKNSGVRES